MASHKNFNRSVQLTLGPRIFEVYGTIQFGYCLSLYQSGTPQMHRLSMVDNFNFYHRIGMCSKHIREDNQLADS